MLSLILGLSLFTENLVRAEPSVLALSPSLSVELTLGPKITMGISFDFRFSVLTEDPRCYSYDTQRGLGGFAQVTWIHFSGWRVAGGLHGGGFPPTVAGVDAEFGLSYRTKVGPGTTSLFGLQLGVTPLFNPVLLLPQLELPFRAILPIQVPSQPAEFLFGSGVRFPGTFQPRGASLCSFSIAGIAAPPSTQA
jgi:hypothetical protein